MAKSTTSYLNAFDKNNKAEWESVENSSGKIEQLTLAFDKSSGDYTRLTRFKSGTNTRGAGVKSHDYPEEILIIKGRLFDQAFNKWLVPGDYASRPPGELHGPFTAEDECVVLEISYPSQTVK